MLEPFLIRGFSKIMNLHIFPIKSVMSNICPQNCLFISSEILMKSTFTKSLFKKFNFFEFKKRKEMSSRFLINAFTRKKTWILFFYENLRIDTSHIT